jgi:hypothetical protein
MTMATRKRFQCLKCKRTFSMAAHLGRHRTTIHGAQAKAKARVPAGVPARLLGAVRAWRGELAAQQAQRAVRPAALDRLLETLDGTAPRTADVHLECHFELPARASAQAWFQQHLPEHTSRAGVFARRLRRGQRDEAVAEILAQVWKYSASRRSNGRAS